ncbi:MAG: Tyrosine recombinase XerC [Chroococcidiopsis cubana SAG 39.79]|uniref:Tyrosine recombinase XerC n=1 Tax=Chroococcidiopsis cubana SAG 39.79 TaxID=388085 RepID=A0AB37U991_9CYAN|nr:tyrosine-type recombinase/integrase [Chroococcidiopsis cubana]MDZ4876858.1 Tyrosine recombinase XerC [Chroococcidiopsis cubana SAG 39.79]PSB54314.1 integrase [Chroococcidiopsis cubana CCALA 043]RUS95265.1 tyrosine recombinase XerC [Chroococcidiopsis cubana SAG 39.79]
MKSPNTNELTLEVAVASFLADLAHANRSAHTRRGYTTDLRRLLNFYSGRLTAITTDHIRKFLDTCTHLSPATVARQQATLASFFNWAYCQELIETNPMTRIERVKLSAPKLNSMGRQQIEKILAAIPKSEARDRLLYRLIFETGLRIGEALAVYIEDLNLTTDDEHVNVVGKGGFRRTVLLDDKRLVAMLRTYLKQTGYKYGPLFRAQKNGRGGPLRYQSVQQKWALCCQKAGIDCTIHQLRHAHATELVNGGVSLATIRKRLGHKNLQTTLRYAEESDATADAEIRTWRRQRHQHS